MVARFLTQAVARYLLTFESQPCLSARADAAVKFDTKPLSIKSLIVVHAQNRAIHWQHASHVEDIFQSMFHLTLYSEFELESLRVMEPAVLLGPMGRAPSIWLRS